MDGKKLRNIIVFTILAIFILNSLAHTFYWYYSIWYFDMVMHFLGGFWVGILYFYIFPNKVSLPLIGKSIIFVLSIGIGWEIFEVVVNLLTVQDNFNYIDTLSDILFDATGGLCAILYIWKKQSKLLSAEARVQ